MFQQNLAAFLLTRGKYSFMSVCGSGDCYVRPTGPRAGSMPAWFPEWDHDYGIPLGEMQRSGDNVFTREWSRCTVRLDCESAEAIFEWKPR